MRLLVCVMLTFFMLLAYLLAAALVSWAASKTWAIHIHVHHHCCGDDPEGDEAELPDDAEPAEKPGAEPDVRVN